MDTMILSIIGFVALGALAVSHVHTVRVLSHKIGLAQALDTPPPTVPDPYNDTALVTALDDLRRRVDDLTMAVAEGIDHVDRNEKRVRGIVVGALRRFDAAGYEDPGVEAEADTLPELHAVGGEPEGVQHVPEILGADDRRSPWLGVPGMEPGPLD